MSGARKACGADSRMPVSSIIWANDLACLLVLYLHFAAMFRFSQFLVPCLRQLAVHIDEPKYIYNSFVHVVMCTALSSHTCIMTHMPKTEVLQQCKSGSSVSTSREVHKENSRHVAWLLKSHAMHFCSV
ncbi:hypothetical protein ABBQ38_008970 [Trebouxia sp. C0009 RCD-2024]